MDRIAFQTRIFRFFKSFPPFRLLSSLEHHDCPSITNIDAVYQKDTLNNFIYMMEPSKSPLSTCPLDILRPIILMLDPNSIWRLRECGDHGLNRRMEQEPLVTELNVIVSRYTVFRVARLLDTFGRHLRIFRLTRAPEVLRTTPDWLSHLPCTLTEIDFSFAGSLFMWVRPLLPNEHVDWRLTIPQHAYTVIDMTVTFPNLEILKLVDQSTQWSGTTFLLSSSSSNPGLLSQQYTKRVSRVGPFTLPRLYQAEADWTVVMVIEWIRRLPPFLRSLHLDIRIPPNVYSPYLPESIRELHLSLGSKEAGFEPSGLPEILPRFDLIEKLSLFIPPKHLAGVLMRLTRVHTLDLDNTAVSESEIHLLPRTVTDLTLHRIASKDLVKLPRSLLTLSIKDLEIPIEVSVDIDIGEMLPPNITRLSLFYVGNRHLSRSLVSVSVHHIPKIGHHLKQLEHLVLHNFHGVLHSLCWVPQGPLKTLEIHSAYDARKLDDTSFNSLGPCKTLTSLIIRSVDASSLDYDFVNNLPPKLTNLTLPMRQLSLEAWGDDQWLQLRSRCPHLKRFTITGNHRSNDDNVMKYPCPSQLSLPTSKVITDSAMTSLKLNMEDSSHTTKAFPDTVTHLTLQYAQQISSLPTLFPNLQILVLSCCSVTDDFLIALPPTTSRLTIDEVVVTEPLRLYSRLKRDLVEIQDLDLVKALCPSVISIRSISGQNHAEYEEPNFIDWHLDLHLTDEVAFISALPRTLTSLLLPYLRDPACFPQLPLQLTYLDIYYAAASLDYEKAPALPSTLKYLNWSFALKSREGTGGTPPKGFFAWLPRALETLVTNADKLNKPMVQQLPRGLTSLILPFLTPKTSLAPSLCSLPLTRLVVYYIESPKVLEAFPKSLTELRSIMKLAPVTWKKLFAVDLPLRYLPHEHCTELKASCNFV